MSANSCLTPASPGLKTPQRMNSAQDERHPSSWFGLHQPFDPEYRIVTSGYLQPHILLGVRVSFAAFTIVACILKGVYEAEIGTPPWW